MEKIRLKLLFVVILFLVTAFAAQPALALDVPLQVKETLGITRTGEMVHNGVPIASEENIKSTANLVVEDAQGNTVPASFEVLSRWAGGKNDTTKAIQWLLISFPCDIDAGATAIYYLRTGTPVALPTVIGLTENAGKYTINTGAAEFVIDTQSMTLLDSIAAGGVDILSGTTAAGNSRSTINGQTAAAANTPTNVTIERQNSLYLCIKMEGDYNNTPVGATGSTKPLSYKIRYEFFAGSPTVVVYHKFYWTGKGNTSRWNFYDGPILVDNVALNLPGMAGCTSTGVYADASTYYNSSLTAGQTAGVGQKLRDPFSSPHQAVVTHGTLSKTTEFATQPMLLNHSANGTVAVSIDHMHCFEPQSIQTDANGNITVNVMAEHQYFASCQGTWARVGISALPAGTTYTETLSKNFAPLNNRLLAFPTTTYCVASGVFKELPATPGANSPQEAQDYYTRLKEVTEKTRELYADEKFHGLMTWGSLVRYADPSYVETGTGDAWDKLYSGGKHSDYHNAWSNVVLQYVLEREPANLYDLSFMGARRMLHTQIIQPDSAVSSSFMGWGYSGYGRYRNDGNSCHSYFDNLYSYYYMTGDMEVLDTVKVGGETKRNWYTRDDNGNLNDPTGGSSSGWNTFVSRTACQTATSFNFLGHTCDSTFLDDFHHMFNHGFSSHIVLLNNGDGKEYAFFCQGEVTSGFASEQSWMLSLYYMDTLYRLYNEWGDISIGVDNLKISRVYRAVANTYRRYISQIVGDGTWGGDWSNKQDVYYTGNKIGGTITSVVHRQDNSDHLLWDGTKPVLMPIIYRAASMNNDVELMEFAAEGMQWLGTARLQTVGRSPWNKVTALFFTRLHHAIAYLFDSNSATIEITSPNGGETLAVAATHNITWNSTAEVGDVTIEYSIDSGNNWTTLTTSTANDGAYSWTVPNAESTSCRVRISEAADGAPADTSDADFTMYAPGQRITVTSPGSGDALQIGTTHQITWSYQDLTGTATIDLYKDGSFQVNLGTASIADRSFTWNISAAFAAGNDYRVLVHQGEYRDFSNGSFTILPAGYAWKAHPDFNGDGKIDILWRNKTDGRNVVWYMDGITRTATGSLPLSNTSWLLSGTGDFNGDGKTDILWRNVSDGRIAVWFMDGAVRTGTEFMLTVSDSNWKIATIGDFDGDGKADILWRNVSDGRIAVWFMDGVVRTNTEFMLTVSDSNWKIAASGDFNGDGQTDILWRNHNSGHLATWFMDGSTRTGTVSLPTVADLNWRVEGTGDINNDGHCDIIWRNHNSGNNVVWYMEGVTQTAFVSLSAVSDLNWEICNNGQDRDNQAGESLGTIAKCWNYGEEHMDFPIITENPDTANVVPEGTEATGDFPEIAAGKEDSTK